MTYYCPCCGASIDEPSPVEALKEAHVSPLVKKAIDVLIAIYPHSMSKADLADMVYLERGKRPEWATSSLSVVIYRANKTLAKSGWYIGVSSKGRINDIALRPL